MSHADSFRQTANFSTLIKMDDVIVRYAETGDFSKIQELLGKPHNIDSSLFEQAFQIAAGKGNTDIVTLLLPEKPYGFDPNANNGYALMEAVKRQHIDTVLRILQDARVDPTVRNNTLLKIKTVVAYPSTKYEVP